MNADRAVRRTAVGVAATLTVSLAVTVMVLLVPSLRSIVTESAATDLAYPVGTRVDVSADLFATTERTLLIFARSSCGGCQRAKPLLRAAAARVQTLDGWSVRFVSTGRLKEDEERYRIELGGDIEMMLADPRSLRLKSVPTLVAVDRFGTVLMSREGIVYSTALESEVLAEIAQVGFRP